MEQIIGISFGAFALIGLYIGFTLGNNIKKYFSREPDVEYVYKNLDIVIEDRVKEIVFNLKANKRTMIGDKEATKIVTEISDEIFNGLSDNMKNYLGITFTEDEIIRYITFTMLKKLLGIMNNVNKR